MLWYNVNYNTHNLNSWKLGGCGLSMISTLGAGKESGLTGTWTPRSQSCFHVSVIIQYEDGVNGSLSGSFMALIRSFLEIIIAQVSIGTFGFSSMLLYLFVRNNHLWFVESCKRFTDFNDFLSTSEVKLT